VTGETIRVSMSLVEQLLIIGGAFVAGFVVGWWVRGG
jgi:hypothetical protein